MSNRCSKNRDIVWTDIGSVGGGKFSCVQQLAKVLHALSYVAQVASVFEAKTKEFTVGEVVPDAIVAGEGLGVPPCWEVPGKINQD